MPRNSRNTRPVTWIEDGAVLGLGGHDVGLSTGGRQATFDREIVRLGRSAREHDLTWVAADQPGNLLSCLLDGIPCGPPESMMAAGRVAESLGEKWLHRLDHPRISRSRGMVIHVDRSSKH